MKKFIKIVSVIIMSFAFFLILTSCTKKYDVIFDSNGGTSVATQIVEENKSATRPTNPTKEGYLFVDWYLDDEVYVFSTKVTKITLLKAKWAELFNITFNSDGGSSVATQEVIENEEANRPTDPTKVGYSFTGWYLNNTLYDFTSPVTNDLTLLAKWTINKYTISFNSDGGSSVTTQEVNYNSNATKPIDPTKVGYTFKGWQLNNVDFNFNTKITSNTTLQAKWEINIYNVSFNSDGGSSVVTQEVNYNNTATKPSDPTKVGHTFKGWFIDDVEFNFTTKVTCNTALIAKWEVNKYTITFDSDGGSSVSSLEIEYNNLVVEPVNPTKEGYNFLGWFLNDVSYDFNTLVISNLTLTAKWEINIYNVSFNSDGGSSVATQEVNYNSTATRPSDPTKVGHTFKGWFIDDVEFNFTTKVTCNTALIAKWEVNKYTITFDSDGGSSVSSLEIEYNNLVVEPVNPTKEGYNFLGWFLNDVSFDFNTQVTSNLTLTAKWEQITLLVTFNSDGGSDVDEQVVNYNDQVIIPNHPTKEGYTFVGWFDGEDLFDFDTLVNNDLSLVAHWALSKDNFKSLYDQNNYSMLWNVEAYINGNLIQSSLLTLKVVQIDNQIHYYAKVDNISFPNSPSIKQYVTRIGNVNYIFMPTEQLSSISFYEGPFQIAIFDSLDFSKFIASDIPYIYNYDYTIEEINLMFGYGDIDECAISLNLYDLTFSVNVAIDDGLNIVTHKYTYSFIDFAITEFTPPTQMLKDAITKNINLIILDHNADNLTDASRASFDILVNQYTQDLNNALDYIDLFYIYGDWVQELETFEYEYDPLKATRNNIINQLTLDFNNKTLTATEDSIIQMAATLNNYINLINQSTDNAEIINLSYACINELLNNFIEDEVKVELINTKTEINQQINEFFGSISMHLSFDEIITIQQQTSLLREEINNAATINEVDDLFEEIKLTINQIVLSSTSLANIEDHFITMLNELYISQNVTYIDLELTYDAMISELTSETQLYSMYETFNDCYSELEFYISKQVYMDSLINLYNILIEDASNESIIELETVLNTYIDLIINCDDIDFLETYLAEGEQNLYVAYVFDEVNAAKNNSINSITELYNGFAITATDESIIEMQTLLNNCINNIRNAITLDAILLLETEFNHDIYVYYVADEFKVELNNLKGDKVTYLNIIINSISPYLSYQDYYEIQTIYYNYTEQINNALTLESVNDLLNQAILELSQCELEIPEFLMNELKINLKNAIFNRYYSMNINYLDLNEVYSNSVNDLMSSTTPYQVAKCYADTLKLFSLIQHKQMIIDSFTFNFEQYELIASDDSLILIRATYNDYIDRIKAGANQSEVTSIFYEGGRLLSNQVVYNQLNQARNEAIKTLTSTFNILKVTATTDSIDAMQVILNDSIINIKSLTDINDIYANKNYYISQLNATYVIDYDKMIVNENKEKAITRLDTYLDGLYQCVDYQLIYNLKDAMDIIDHYESLINQATTVEEVNNLYDQAKNELNLLPLVTMPGSISYYASVKKTEIIEYFLSIQESQNYFDIDAMYQNTITGLNEAYSVTQVVNLYLDCTNYFDITMEKENYGTNLSNLRLSYISQATEPQLVEMTNLFNQFIIEAGAITNSVELELLYNDYVESFHNIFPFN